MKNEYIEINAGEENIKIHYRSIGSGPLLVVIHGWMHSHKVWLEVAERLKDNWTVLLFDLPGFGYSDRLPHNFYKISAYSHVTHDIIQKLVPDKQPDVIIADSLGAIIVMKLLTAGARLANKYVLMGSPVDGLPFYIRWMSLPGCISISLRLLGKLPNNISKLIFKTMALGTVRKFKDIRSSITESALIADPIASESLFRELCSPADYDTHTLRDKEIYILRGEKDRIVSHRSLSEFSTKISSSLHTIPGAGHTPMVEKEELFVSYINSILK